MIIVTLAGVTVQKKNRQETTFWSTPQEERKMIATIPHENSVNYTSFVTTYSKFKTSSDVVNKEKIYEIVANRNSIQKITKSWSRRVNKMSCSANPRVVFNILRSLPMGEPYFIQ
jgi:hypothetical protein